MPRIWIDAAAVLLAATLLGGFLGGKLARRLPENVLRWSVVVLGVAVGLYLLFT